MGSRWSWFLFLIVAGCAPEPRHVACSNDGQCEKAGGKFRYCLESRCVECVGIASCGDGRACVDGACECVSHQGCGMGEECADGQCRPKGTTP
jgi:peptidoglycan-associated lipoprotein